MTDTVLDHVKQHIAMLDGFLSEAVHDFGRSDVLSKIEALTARTVAFESLSESEAAHAARIMTCLSMLTVISEDVSQLGKIDSFETFDGSMQPVSLANAVASARQEGLGQKEIEATLADILASPVFTAHPTEMRRASIVEREYEIARLPPGLREGRQPGRKEPDPGRSLS